MTPSRWQEVKQLLDRAFEHAPTARAAFLDQACRDDAELRNEVEAFMNYETQAHDFLPTPVLHAANITEQNHSYLIDQLIGAVLDEKYQIEKKLGQGGMGAVYLATHLGT